MGGLADRAPSAADEAIGQVTEGAGVPAILVVLEDDSLRHELCRLLDRRFGRNYDIVACGLQDADPRLAQADRVAAVITDSGPGKRSGIDLLTRAHAVHPDARRVLLLDRGQWSSDHPIRQAIVTGLVDGYLFVPWGALEQFLYHPMTEYLAEWCATQPAEYVAARIVGRQWEARSHEVRDLFSLASIRFEFFEPDSTAGRALLAEAGVDGSRLPVVVFHGGTTLIAPTDADILDKLGFQAEPRDLRCDVAIVGAGPSGLSTAVYASSEGLRAVLIDSGLPGGQAGTSSMIRNYLGFPHGVSGGELARRALEQAWLFGTEVLTPHRAITLEGDGDTRIVRTAQGATVTARAVVIATGVSWRRLEVPSIEALVGSGVFYGAGASEASALAGEDVYIVGGGNSAGQAAVHLARHARRVTILIRRKSLAATMSEYLIQEIGNSPNVVVRPRSEIVAGHGSGRLEALTIRDRESGAEEQVKAAALFVMIGGEPRTEWLADTLHRDDYGYLVIGGELLAAGRGSSTPSGQVWVPMFLETSMSGVFAVGDVRSGSVKRVAPSVGSGAIAVQLIHEYLAREAEAREEYSAAPAGETE